MTFTARSDRRFIRSTYRSNRFVLAEIDAPAARRERKRPPVHLAFVIDRSGSMGGEKIRLAKLAVEESLARLHDDDRFAIVVYDEAIDVVFPSTLATPDARRSALARLSEIDARGSTDLGGGWLRGCEQVALALSEEGVNRTLLLTDGLANVGITDRDELARHAAELRARGVSTTTFGVGQDFDEVLLQAMADAGGGHFYFIADAAAIRDYVTSEVGETLEIVARDVSLQVSAPDGVQVEPLSPFPSQASRDGRTVLNLGDLVAEQRLQVVLRLNFPYGEIGHETGALVSLSDRDDVSRRRLGQARLGVRRQPGERPPGSGPRRRPSRRPDLRGASPSGGNRPEPNGRLPRRPRGPVRRRPPDPRLRRPRPASCARSSASSSARPPSWPHRWPSFQGRKCTSRAPTTFGCGPPMGRQRRDRAPRIFVGDSFRLSTGSTIGNEADQGAGGAPGDLVKADGRGNPNVPSILALLAEGADPYEATGCLDPR